MVKAKIQAGKDYALKMKAEAKQYMLNKANEF